MEAQQTVPNPAPISGSTAAEDAALSIYDTLTKEGYLTEEKIAIVKGVAGLIRSDIDQNIKQLQQLKTSF